MITTKDNKIFQAEGYSVEEISQILHDARSITATDTKKLEITSDTVTPSQQP